MNANKIDAFVVENNQIRDSIAVDDSSHQIEQETVQEAQPIEKLKNDLIDPYDEILQASCEAAIASYLASIQNSNIDEISNPETQTVEGSHKIEVIDDCRKPCTCCFVIPPYLMKQIYTIDEIRAQMLVSNESQVKSISEGQQTPISEGHQAVVLQAKANNGPIISVYDAKNRERLPGTVATSNQKENPHVADPVVNTAFKRTQAIHEFWLKVFGMCSFDNRNGEIRTTVHFGKNFANAFWNGQQLVFGDGDKTFKHLLELSVMGHEFGHAITGSKLNYKGESGALNEHLSDVWGSLFLQYKMNHTVDQASWLIGEGTLETRNGSFALRSMKAPGTAYNIPALGKDPQPDHYTKRYKGREDEGGVHINSGIPNKAFYLFANAQGGYAWEKAGLVWFKTLQADGLFTPNCTMPEFARATIATAKAEFPNDAKLVQDLRSAWQSVGVI